MPDFEALRRVDVTVDPGGTSVRVVYPKHNRLGDGEFISKGDAWDHLWANPPGFEIAGELCVPLFDAVTMHTGEHRKRHPYLKDHNGESWAWRVIRWRRGTPKPRPPKPPKPVPKSRYELMLDDDWLGPGVQDPG